MNRHFIRGASGSGKSSGMQHLVTDLVGRDAARLFIIDVCGNPASTTPMPNALPAFGASAPDATPESPTSAPASGMSP